MPISRKQFEDDAFYRSRSTNKQAQFMKFLLENKEKAYTTKEIAKVIYRADDDKAIAKAYFVLTRLVKKGLVEKKIPYWSVKKIK